MEVGDCRDQVFILLTRVSSNRPENQLLKGFKNAQINFCCPKEYHKCYETAQKCGDLLWHEVLFLVVSKVPERFLSHKRALEVEQIQRKVVRSDRHPVLQELYRESECGEKDLELSQTNVLMNPAGIRECIKSDRKRRHGRFGFLSSVTQEKSTQEARQLLFDVRQLGEGVAVAFNVKIAVVVRKLG